MKKDLGALNDYLFEQLERLNDDEELTKTGANIAKVIDKTNKLKSGKN